MNEKELVNAYAKAVFEAVIEKVTQELTAVMQKLTVDSDLALALSDPGKGVTEKQLYLDKLLSADASPEVKNFLLLLLSKQQLDLLPEIVDAIRVIAFTREGVPQVVEVVSAMVLTDDQRQKMETKLRQQFGSSLQFQYKVDKALIGGLVVRVGDKLVDQSVAGRLRALREQMLSAVA